jgi:hypothetical protein
MMNKQLLIFFAVFISTLYLTSAYYQNNYIQQGYNYNNYNNAANLGRYDYSYSYSYGPSYGSQFSLPNSYRVSAAGNYAAGYGNKGLSPALMPSTSYNPVFGFRQNFDSHINIRNSLDNTYYNNPQLFATQGISNHQRYVKGLWPQTFRY